MQLEFTSADFRRILGHYLTGVCAVTSMADDGPVGMIVGSFTSVSLDPPLVAFFPDRKSGSWAKIQSTGRFCVNILADHQGYVCRALSAKQVYKFEGIPFDISEAGLPIIHGVVAWIDCDLDAVHEAGDHFVVIGRVHSLDIAHPGKPLLFYRGGYGQFFPLIEHEI